VPSSACIMAAATIGGTTGTAGAMGSRASALGAGGVTGAGVSRTGDDVEGAAAETVGAGDVDWGFRTAGCDCAGMAAGAGLPAATAGAGEGTGLAGAALITGFLGSSEAGFFSSGGTDAAAGRTSSCGACTMLRCRSAERLRSASRAIRASSCGSRTSFMNGIAPIPLSMTISVGPPIITRCSTLSRRTRTKRRRASTAVASNT